MKRSSRRAWVVRWVWVGEHARVAQPIAAILPAQFGHDTVRRIVDALYAGSEYTPAEMLEATRRGGHNPYAAELGTVTLIREDGSTGYVPWQGEVACGHNPRLVARLANVHRDSDSVESVAYVDDKRPVMDLRGWRPPNGRGD